MFSPSFITFAPSIPNIAGSCVVAWAIWKLLRNFLVASPFDRIPGPKPTSVLYGNFLELYRPRGWDFLADIEENYAGVATVTGVLGRKALFVKDPKALHAILVKDHYHVYDSPRWRTASIRLLFGPGLISLRGEQHRQQRKMLNPVFSINHMRYMTPIFYEISHRLRNGITNQVKEGPQDVDILEWTSRTALELIGQGGLGYSFDPLMKSTPNAFAQTLKALPRALFSVQIFRMFSNYLPYLGPPAFRSKLAEIAPFQRVQKIKKIVDTADRYTRELYSTKKSALAAGDAVLKEQVGEGKDIMSILLRANVMAPEEDRLSESEVLAQMSLLVFAATDTTSSTLSQILQLLSTYKDVQSKLREELVQARNGADSIPHDQLMALPYLDAVCRETLRLHPAASIMYRETYKDAVLPLTKPITGTDGKLIHEIQVPKHTLIMCGVRACNKNQELWGEDAHDWKPERWLSPLPETLVNTHIPGVYSNLMSFGGGNRSCIGFKFAQLEMKVVLSVLLTAFKFSEAENAKDIGWNLANVRYPTVGDSPEPACPIKIECIHDAGNNE